MGKKQVNRWTLMISAALVCALLLSACTQNGQSNAPGAAIGAGDTAAVNPVSVEYDSEDADTSWNITDSTQILLDADGITLGGPGATVEGSTVLIDSAGTYVISGTLADGQILVNSRTQGTVKLVLDGASITCTTSSPIYIMAADKVVLTLTDVTQNTLTDGAKYTTADTADEPNAALFSQCDLTINGRGALTVNGTCANGIASKDELRIIGGNITVNATADGIRGRDCVIIKDAAITVDAKEDGIKSSNDSDAAKGYIAIQSGTVNITAGADGIQAATSLLISDGGCIALDVAGDGLDINGTITISGGTIIVNGPTDNGNGALDCDGSFQMTGGLLVAAGSSGMASDISSTQYIVKITFDAILPAGSMVHIETTAGEDVLTFVPAKSFQTVLFCSPELKKGSDYSVYYGGCSTGTVQDGLYTDGRYTAGTRFTVFTISGIVTAAGTAVGSFGSGAGTGGR